MEKLLDMLFDVPTAVFVKSETPNAFATALAEAHAGEFQAYAHLRDGGGLSAEWE